LGCIQNLAVLRIFKFQAAFAPFGGEISQVIHFRRAAIVGVRQARRRFRRQWLLKASKYEALSADAIRIANPIANVFFYNNHWDYRINGGGVLKPFPERANVHEIAKKGKCNPTG
jgi:hypothetical protein